VSDVAASAKRAQRGEAERSGRRGSAAPYAVGVDFGTTNSALAVAGEDGVPRLARFAREGGETDVFRSLLYFERDADAGGRVRELAGPRAIERWLEADEKGRLMQSLKSFLAARDFSATTVFGASYRIEALVAIVLRELRREAEQRFGPLGRRVVAGRPVRFAAQASPEDEQLALTRLRAAFHNAGFEDVVFEYEPVAAAYWYERGLDHDELIVIGDFGGGTSDFSLLRVGPGARGRRAQALLGNAGVALAGDAFDGRIVREVVAPLLGYGTRYRSIFGRELHVPGWIYTHLQRWHHVSFLKSPRTLQLLFDLCREALEPEKLQALLALVRADQGFVLHRSVEATKLALSAAERAPFRFAVPPVRAEADVSRSAFEEWIAEDLAAIAGCVDDLLDGAQVKPGDVDRVFLTGGSSLVPAVRRLFTQRFGEAKLAGGNELTSVAGGLALRAAELEPAA
jgi:hypothetical chaperone protein